MQLLISSEGAHEPAGYHLMIVDSSALLIDLSGVSGSLHDPSIKRVEWGLVQDGIQQRPGGFITRQDNSRTPFFDATAIAPYINAFNVRKAEIAP